MANPEHVASVRGGRKAVTEWRKAHPEIRFDLTQADLRRANLANANLSNADLWEARLEGANLFGADLSEARLSKADLSDADLRSADLRGADLRGARLFAELGGAEMGGADLTGADLNGADLRGANLRVADLFGADLGGANLWNADLRGADLRQAELRGTDLRGADLSAADLRRANLRGADLRGANLAKARLEYTTLINLDLSAVVGLADVRPIAPITVTLDTLVASFRGAGNKFTPELRSFFRDAGVLQELLDALPAILADVKYYSCFISYGQPDLPLATKLYEDLKARGISCWLYELDKTVGKRTWGEIGEARRSADKFVVLCSVPALLRDGVLQEIEDQINEDPDRLVPVSLDDLWREPGFRIVRGNHDLRPELENRNCANFAAKPYDEALEELLKGLRLPGIEQAGNLT